MKHDIRQLQSPIPTHVRISLRLQSTFCLKVGSRTHQHITEIDDRPTVAGVHVRYGVDDDFAGEDEDGVDEPGA